MYMYVFSYKKYESGERQWKGERGERLEGNKVEEKDSLVIYYTSEVLPYQRDRLQRYSGNLKNRLRPRLGFHSLYYTTAKHYLNDKNNGLIFCSSFEGQASLSSSLMDLFLLEKMEGDR